jgi:DNA-binding response OmpR family regulator
VPAVDVLLIATEWRLRALLRAELLEEGYEVKAVVSWDEGELLLRARAVQPRVIVYDVHGERDPHPALQTLARLRRGSAVLVLTAHSVASPDAIAPYGFSRTLVRPFRIGDAVEAIRGIIGGRSGTGG